MGYKIIGLLEYSPEKHDLLSYTTIRRKGKGHALFNPHTYENKRFTKEAWGRSINLSLENLIELMKKNPKAYIFFLVDDGKSKTCVQVRNVRLEVFEA